VTYQALVSLDGSHSGEIDQQRVNYTDVCLQGWEWQDERQRCNLWGVVNNQNSTQACQGGDSGGPVFQVYPGSYLFAAALGIVVGGAAPGGGSTQCWYLGMQQMLAPSVLNGTLLYAP